MSIEIIKEALDNQKEMIKDFVKKVEDVFVEQKNIITRIDELEESLKKRRISVPGLEDYADKFSIARAAKAIITNDWSEAGFEKEVFAEAQKKAMGATGSSNMGFFVPVEILQGYIEKLEAEAVTIKMGATVLQNLTGIPAVIPKQVGGSTGYWVGENASITESELSGGQLSMTPKRAAALCKVSNTLLKYSNPSVEDLIRRDLFTRIALQIDYAALEGTGSEYKPRGILYAGINSVSGSTLTFDMMYDMQYELQKDNAYRGKLGYVFHPAVKRTLVKMKVAQFTGDSNGMYVIQPMVAENEFASWLGHPYAMSTQIAPSSNTGSQTANIFFGNWEEMIIAMWGVIELKVSQETSTAFEYDQTWIRIIQDVDIGVRHAESFCYAQPTISA